MVIKMTQSEYQKKYGQAPVVSTPTTQPTQPTQSQPGYFQRLTENVGTDIANRVDKYNQISQSDAPFLEKTIQKFGQGTGLASNALEQTVAQLPGVNKLTQKAGESMGKGIGVLTNSFPVKQFGNLIGGTKLAQDLVNAYDNDENFKNTIDAIANTGRLGANIEGAKDVANLGVKGVQMGANLTQKGLSSALKPTSRALKSGGEGLYSITAPPEQSTARALMTYDAKQPNLFGRIKNFMTGESVGTRPITEANTAARQGLMGTEYQIGVQAKKALPELWKNIEPQLAKSKRVTDMKSFLGSVEKQIVKDTKDLTQRKSLLEALSKVREDYSSVRGKINLSKLQDYKEGWAKFLPDSTYNGKPIANSLKAVHDLMANQARKVIYANIDDAAKLAYQDYGNLQSIIEAGVKSITGDAAKRSLGRNVWEFVMDKAVTPVATVGGQILYRTGEGIEMLGQKGAKTIGDVIGETMNKDITPGFTSLQGKANEAVQAFSKNPKIGLSIDDVSKSNPLIQEAKKYKSAEEFVKAQGTPIYHGSNEKIKIFSPKKGAQGVIWFTDNPKAITAGESGASGIKFINERITTGKKFAGWDEYEKLPLSEIERMGFEGIKLPTSMNDGTPYNNYILFDNKTIKSKSQLIDIWKKANGK